MSAVLAVSPDSEEGGGGCSGGGGGVNELTERTIAVGCSWGLGGVVDG